MRIKPALLAVLLFVLPLAGCGAGNEGEEDIPAYLVVVTAQGTWGSGIIYRMDGESLNVLTAAHVVEDRPPGGDRGNGPGGLLGSVLDSDSVESGETGLVTVRFCDGWEVSGTDIVVSGTADVAVIRIPASEISTKRQQQYQCVYTDKEGFDKLMAGNGCAAVGIGAGAEVVRYEGYILEPWIYMEDYGQYMIWAQAGIESGMSGGGLFDDGGRLIGILSGGNEDGELAAVPLSLVLQFDMEVLTISENF